VRRTNCVGCPPRINTGFSLSSGAFIRPTSTNLLAVPQVAAPRHPPACAVDVPGNPHHGVRPYEPPGVRSGDQRRESTANLHIHRFYNCTYAPRRTDAPEGAAWVPNFNNIPALRRPRFLGGPRSGPRRRKSPGAAGYKARRPRIFSTGPARRDRHVKSGKPAPTPTTSPALPDQTFGSGRGPGSS